MAENLPDILKNNRNNVDDNRDTGTDISIGSAPMIKPESRSVISKPARSKITAISQSTSSVIELTKSGWHCASVNLGSDNTDGEALTYSVSASISSRMRSTDHLVAMASAAFPGSPGMIIDRKSVV